jgi:hypothetical protein
MHSSISSNALDYSSEHNTVDDSFSYNLTVIGRLVRNFVPFICGYQQDIVSSTLQESSNLSLITNMFTNAESIIISSCPSNRQSCPFSVEAYHILTKQCHIDVTTIQNVDLQKLLKYSINHVDIDLAQLLFYKILSDSTYSMYQESFDKWFTYICNNDKNNALEDETKRFFPNEIKFIEWAQQLCPERYILLRNNEGVLRKGYIYKEFTITYGICTNMITDKIEKCNICDETVCDVITKCKHMFCVSCIQYWCNEYTSNCPLCRKTIKLNNLRKIVEPESPEAHRLIITESWDDDDDNDVHDYDDDDEDDVYTIYTDGTASEV